MISEISFGSTYKFSHKKNDKTHYNKVAEYGKLLAEKRLGRIDSPKHSLSLCVYDSMDSEVENFCKTNGIKYVKKSNIECVKERIEKPANDLHLAWLDYKKLLEISRNQQSDIDTVKDGYEGFFKDRVKNNFICNPTIRPTYLNIKGAYLSDEYLLDKIKKDGVLSLDEDVLLVDFVQKTLNLDHCSAFLLNEMGMNTIPFYMDDITLKYANAMGIVKE